MNAIPMQYSIVQYFDDPMRNEPRNIGIVLRDPRDQYLHYKFLQGKDLQAKLRHAAKDELAVIQAYIETISSLRVKTTHSEKALELMFGPVNDKNEMPRMAYGKIKLSEPRGALVSDIMKETDYLYNAFVFQKMEKRKQINTQFKSEVKRVLSERNLLKGIKETHNSGFLVNAAIKSKHSKVQHNVDFLRMNGHITVLESVDLKHIDSTPAEHKTFEAALKLEDLRESYGKREFKGFAIVSGVGDSAEAEYCLKVLRAYSDQVIDFSIVKARDVFLSKLEHS